jgi:N-acetylmuramoyl-L-alanine amidase
MSPINRIILHCSGTNIVTYDFDAIKVDHVNNRNWSDIGYHLGVDFNAGIHVLRPIEIQGAHTKGHNGDSIGICVLGLHSFTKRQFEALGKLCEMLMKIFNIKKNNVYGHNHFNHNKTCPTFDVEWFKEQFMGR